MKVLAELIEKILSRLNLRKKLAVAVSIIFVTIFWIHSPWITNNCYIKVSKRLLFEIPKNFVDYNIVFKNSVYIKAYSIWLFNEKGKQYEKGKNVKLGKKLNHLTIDADIIKKLKNETFEKLRIDVFYSQPMQIEIKEVYINGSKINLKTFFDKNLKTMDMDKVYVDRVYTREYISQFLLRYNDQISNYLLTIIFLLSMYLVIQLFTLSIRYKRSDKAFKRYIFKEHSLSNPEFNENFHIEVDNAKHEYAESYLRKDTWLRFLQVMGPAFGFILTVASLITALHPSIQQKQNISTFFGAIQVAMVSTFLGLLIRMLAVFLQRVNDKLFNRADKLFTGLHS